jgi:hypothetical protein
MRKAKVIFTVLVMSFGISLVGSVESQADSLTVLGGTVTWPDKMYDPTNSSGCTNVGFGYENGTGIRLLQLGFVLADPFGRKVAGYSKVGIDPNKSGTWNIQICSLPNGLGPYEMTVFVEDYSSTQRQITKEIYFLEIPAATPKPTPTVTITKTPAPAPTVTVTATPAPAPTVTVTATPAPAPTVTVTATPAPAPTVTVTATPAPAPTVTITATPAPDTSKIVSLEDALKGAQSQIKSLKSKLTKICSAKPKPKSC